MTNYFFQLTLNINALLCLPASYIAGKMMLVRAIVGGFNLLTIEPTANPFENLNLKIDFTAITPYQLFHSIGSLHIKNIRKIIVGGSPVTTKLEKLSERIPSELYVTYGMTETCSHIALRRFNGTEKSEYFTVLDGVSIRRDERECLSINAPHLFADEIQTNDMVELISPRSFRWLGRVDATINTGGVKIHPEQVEKKLEGIINHNYFISSLPDDLLENNVILIIESETYTAEQELNLKFKLKQLLNRFEFPKHIYFLSDFVYSDSKKLLRKETLAQVILR
jgi:O-succinylbenzoic acid--CoA ligase